VELAGEEVARVVGERTRLEGAAEVQLERVDPSKRNCVEPIEVSLAGAPVRVSPASRAGLLGLNCIESPSGSKPDGLPARVRPTRW
jgi:hypothetical protein